MAKIADVALDGAKKQKAPKAPSKVKVSSEATGEDLSSSLHLKDALIKEANGEEFDELAKNDKTIIYFYKSIFNKIFHRADEYKKMWEKARTFRTLVYYLIAKQVEAEKRREQKAIEKSPVTKIGLGYDLKDHNHTKLVEINIKNEFRKNHIFLFGSTGVGKTRAMELMVQQDIMAGRSVIFIDPKSDLDMYNTMFYYALKAGRENDFMFLSPIQADYSIEANPTSHYYIWEEVVEHVMASVPADDAFFYNVAKETTMAIVQAIILQRKSGGKTDRINFDEIASYATYQGLQDIRQQTENIRDLSLDEEKKHCIRLLDQILSSPVDYFSKVSTTLRSALNIMTNGSIGKVLGNAEKNDLVERLEKGKGVILLVQTGTMIARDTANVVGKEVLSMLQSVVGRYYVSGKTFPVPVCLYVDELSNVVYKGIENLYNKGRGAKLWIMGATQSVADMIAVIGEDGAKQLLDNTNTKIIMRLQDTNSAELFQILGGTRKRLSVIMAAEGSVTGREVEEDVLKPEDILRLNAREFFYFGFEGQFYGKIRKIPPTPCRLEMDNILQTEEAPNIKAFDSVGGFSLDMPVPEDIAKSDEVYYITQSEKEMFQIKGEINKEQNEDKK